MSLYQLLQITTEISIQYDSVNFDGQYSHSWVVSFSFAFFPSDKLSKEEVVSVEFTIAFVRLILQRVFACVLGHHLICMLIEYAMQRPLEYVRKFALLTF